MAPLKGLKGLGGGGGGGPSEIATGGTYSDTARPGYGVHTFTSSGQFKVI